MFDFVSNILWFFCIANVIFIPICLRLVYLIVKKQDDIVVAGKIEFTRKVVFITSLIVTALFLFMIFISPSNDSMIYVPIFGTFVCLLPYWFFGLIFLFVKTKSEKVKEETSSI